MIPRFYLARATGNFLAAKLRGQLVLLVLLSGLPLIALLVLNVKDQYQDTLADALDHAAAVSHQIRFSVDGYITYAESMLRIAEVILSPGLDDVKGNDAKLKTLYDKSPKIFESIWVSAADGRLLNSLSVPPADRGGFTASDRRYLKEAMERGEMVLDGPILSRATSRWILTMAYPIGGVADNARAVVAGSIDLERFQDLLTAEDLPAGSVIMIVSGEGNVIAANSRAWVGKDVRAVPWIEHALRDREDKEELTFADGTRHIAGYTTATRAPWLVYVGIPRNVALRPGRLALQQLLVISLLVLTAGIVMAWLVSGLITRPVERLAEDIARLGAGDLSHRSAVESKNEIGSLARGFNRMAEALEGRTQAVKNNLQRIQALHDIDTAITSTLNLESVLEILLDKIETLCPFAAAAGVRLWDGAAGKLVPLAAKNIPLEEWKAELARDNGFVSKHFIENKSLLVVHNLLADPRITLKDFARRHGLVSYLGVPLVAQGKMIGSLAIYTREEREFPKEEIDFILTLAGQAAIAIHNAWLYEQVLRANRTKDEFLSVMSHELRTPLSVVTGYVGLMKDGMLGAINQEQEAALNKVLARAHDQLAMINNILFAALLEAGTIATVKAPVRISDIFKELMAAYNPSAQAGVAIRWEVAGDAPPVMIDKGKIENILENLINNALKFTAQGNVTISARILPPAAGGGALELKVADTGVGIDPNDLPFIFDKFHQADSSETRRYGGVGMGLYIVKSFAELLGGAVRVESEPGIGSTFTVTLPLEN